MAKTLAIALGGPVLIVVCSAAAAPEPTATSPQVLSQSLAEARADVARPCHEQSSAEVVVCGKSQQRYRIDPDVLAATRAAEAPPPKPQLDASTAGGCIGPNCGGATIPLVGVALTAIRAAALAANGDDWREAFRTHPDQYQLYRQSEAAKKRNGISIGLSAGNK